MVLDAVWIPCGIDLRVDDRAYFVEGFSEYIVVVSTFTISMSKFWIIIFRSVCSLVRSLLANARSSGWF